MEFIEAGAFTRYVYDYLSEDEYLGLQSFLFQFPESGKIVPGLVESGKSAGRCQEEVKAVASG